MNLVLIKGVVAKPIYEKPFESLIKVGFSVLYTENNKKGESKKYLFSVNYWYSNQKDSPLRWIYEDEHLKEGVEVIVQGSLKVYKDAFYIQAEKVEICRHSGRCLPQEPKEPKKETPTPW